MAPLIPARCLDCGHQWQPVVGGIKIEGAEDVTIHSDAPARCPDCGGVARFLDGTFNVVDGAIQMTSGPLWSWDLVEELRLTLGRIIDEKPADPIAALAAVEPLLADDVDRVTARWTGERKLNLIASILGILTAGYVAGAAAVEHVPQLMHQVADLLDDAQQEDPPPLPSPKNPGPSAPSP